MFNPFRKKQVSQENSENQAKNLEETISEYMKKDYPHGFPSCYVPRRVSYYEVPVGERKGKILYMKDDKTRSHSHVPIIVISDIFLKLWGDYSDRISEFEKGALFGEHPELWAKDSKLKSGYVEKCFSYGINNPVPLAAIADFRNGKITLTDGITRTLYLLINKADAFPIMCPKHCAEELSKLASVEAYPPEIINEE